MTYAAVCFDQYLPDKNKNKRKQNENKNKKRKQNSFCKSYMFKIKSDIHVI